MASTQLHSNTQLLVTYCRGYGQQHSLILSGLIILNDNIKLVLLYPKLHGEGYNVETFSNPHEALLRFVHSNRSYYDLVILDIRMPNLNGLQLYHRLKAINKDIKILFLSALEVSEEITSIFPELKNEDIIRKPISREHLVKKINTLL